MSIDSCSGFGRYQAVETVMRAKVFGYFVVVAVGLAAIRPLKLPCTGHSRNLTEVAVGLAAIRPLKRKSGCFNQSHCRLQWVWPLSGR